MKTAFDFSRQLYPKDDYDKDDDDVVGEGDIREEEQASGWNSRSPAAGEKPDSSC